MCKNINPMQIFLFDTLSDNWESIDIPPYSLSAHMLRTGIMGFEIRGRDSEERGDR